MTLLQAWALAARLWLRLRPVLTRASLEMEGGADVNNTSKQMRSGNPERVQKSQVYDAAPREMSHCLPSEHLQSHSLTVINCTPEPMRWTGFFSFSLTVCSCRAWKVHR